MAPNLFSIPIFFIVFREALEASIIVSVLLGLVEQIVLKNGLNSPPEIVQDHHEAPPPIEEKPVESSSNRNNDNTPGESTPQDSDSATVPQGPEDNAVIDRRLVRKLRWQIFLGGLSGFLIAVAIGAAFIAVWFTQASDLWMKSENLWEGVFSLIA